LQSYISEHESVRVQCYRLLTRLFREEQELAETLRQRGAEQRMAAFLLQMKAHQCPGDADFENVKRRIQIPMTRRDLANHLGMSVETVSRVFSRLQRTGIIRVVEEQLEFIDISQLRSIANN